LNSGRGVSFWWQGVYKSTWNGKSNRDADGNLERLISKKRYLKGECGDKEERGKLLRS